jgi:hypothetical protein
MPNEYARAVHELVQAKIEQRAPEVEIETEKRETPKVVNIMDALKKSMQARGQTKVKDSVRKRMGKAALRVESLLHHRAHGRRGERPISFHRRRLAPNPFRCTSRQRLPRSALQLRREKRRRRREIAEAASQPGWPLLGVGE